MKMIPLSVKSRVWSQIIIRSMWMCAKGLCCFHGHVGSVINTFWILCNRMNLISNLLNLYCCETIVLRPNCFLTPPWRSEAKLLLIMSCYVTSVTDWNHWWSGSLSNGVLRLPPQRDYPDFSIASELLCAASVKCNFLCRESMKVSDRITLLMMLG